jgi:hypothetical protein
MTHLVGYVHATWFLVMWMKIAWLFVSPVNVPDWEIIPLPGEKRKGYLQYPHI